MKRFVELFWVIFVILTGIGIRLFDGAGDDPDIGNRNLLIGAGILSLGVVIFFLINLLKHVDFSDRWFKYLIRAVVESLWVFAIVWSSSAVIAEFLCTSVEMWTTATWASFDVVGTAIKLLALLLIVVRVVIAIKHSKQTSLYKKS